MSKNRKAKRNKFLTIFGGFCGLCVAVGAFVLYGPWSGFRDFWITTAMTTMSHQYLATWIYSDETIDKVLAENTISEVEGTTDLDAVELKQYTAKPIYKNKYDEDVLTKDPDNDLYKVIHIEERTFDAYLVVLYDPSRISLAYSKYLGNRGEWIYSVSKRTDATIVMNAGGFGDPGGMGSGGVPKGMIISEGKIVGDFEDGAWGNGVVCFTKENKLYLGRDMTAKEALAYGCRDAIEFGPFLIVNGVSSKIKGNGGAGYAPRTAIGQRRDGIVLMLVTNGRRADMLGARMTDVLTIMENYGAYNATNLDGGGSTELLINNKLINVAVAGGVNGTRDMPTFWVVK